MCGSRSEVFYSLCHRSSLTHVVAPHRNVHTRISTEMYFEATLSMFSRSMIAIKHVGSCKNLLRSYFFDLVKSANCLDSYSFLCFFLANLFRRPNSLILSFHLHTRENYVSTVDVPFGYHNCPKLNMPQGDSVAMWDCLVV